MEPAPTREERPREELVIKQLDTSWDKRVWTPIKQIGESLSESDWADSSTQNTWEWKTVKSVQTN